MAITTVPVVMSTVHVELRATCDRCGFTTEGIAWMRFCDCPTYWWSLETKLAPESYNVRTRGELLDVMTADTKARHYCEVWYHRIIPEPIQVIYGDVVEPYFPRTEPVYRCVIPPAEDVEDTGWAVFSPD